jgi:hypothetical protein
MMTFFDRIFSLGVLHDKVERAARAVMKHALSVHFATRMRAFARVPTTLEATFGPRKIRVLTVALRPLRAPRRRKTLEKKAFQRHRARNNACESTRMCYFPRRFSLRGNSGTAFHAHKILFEE